MIKVLRLFNDEKDIDYYYMFDGNLFKDDDNAREIGKSKLLRWLWENGYIEDEILLNYAWIDELDFSHDCLINKNYK